MSRRAVKESTSGKHIGFGKVILFGEHLVVYGAEAIVAGVEQYTECKLEVMRGTPGWEVVDKRPAVPGYIVKKAAEQKLAHKLVFDHQKIDLSQDGLRVHLGGPLVPSSGIGASASDVVALSRALGELYNIQMTEDQVNYSAYVGEGGYHGTPSGVDNTAATFGGLLTYQKTKKGPKFSKIQFTTPLTLVVVGTGITASTTDVLADVRKLKERQPAFFATLMERYNQLLKAGQAAIANGDLEEIGRVMNLNHSLLQELTVSCDELNSIVDCCKHNGAIGAKMSGTGRGGIAVALVRDKEAQQKVVEALKAKCPAAKFIWQYSVSPAVSAKL